MRETILNNQNDAAKNINNLHTGNEIKIIFSDVDGTIIPLNNDYKVADVPNSLISSAKILYDKKIPLVLVTGRALNEIKNVSDIIGNNQTYYILLHGAEIYSPNLELIYQDQISKDSLKEICQEIKEFARKNNCNPNFYFVYKGEQYSTRPFKLPYNGKDVKVISSLDSLGEDYNVGKLLICEENNKKRVELQKFLSKRFEQLHVELSGDSYCDITNKSANKGSAIEHFAKIMNIDLKNAAVFGDAENDKTMLEVVNHHGGLTIAVENGVEELKQKAKYITKSVYDDGFSYALEKIVENNEANKKTLFSKNWR